ncbi:MAG: hypothetical protein LC700_03735 [Actinobacteria bacterium]|nr:hypothetical protein [Actinomycetota bacterium]
MLSSVVSVSSSVVVVSTLRPVVSVSVSGALAASRAPSGPGQPCCGGT